MILSDRSIKEAIKDGSITIDPLDPSRIQPASVDLTLGGHFLVFDTNSHYVIDVREPMDDLMKEVVINETTHFIIHPGEFALGVTYETIGVSDKMVGRLEGKSSLGRIGLIVHATAGYLDPGNKLKMTLELHNIGTLPIKLYYKMPIAQMAFTPLSSPAENPYGSKKLNSKYYGNTKSVASQMHKNFFAKQEKEQNNDVY